MNDVDKIKIQQTDSGAIISVKAVPGASRDKIVAVLGDRLKITVSAPPEKGKANKAIEKLLAKKLSLSTGEVKLISGSTNPNKDFLISGLSKKTLVEKLAKL